MKKRSLVMQFITAAFSSSCKKEVGTPGKCIAARDLIARFPI
jgi:hypothetical protein